jgi:hypothetical protein
MNNRLLKNSLIYGLGEAATMRGKDIIGFPARKHLVAETLACLKCFGKKFFTRKLVISWHR